MQVEPESFAGLLRPDFAGNLRQLPATSRDFLVIPRRHAFEILVQSQTALLQVFERVRCRGRLGPGARDGAVHRARDAVVRGGGLVVVAGAGALARVVRDGLQVTATIGPALVTSAISGPLKSLVSMICIPR